jgi:hypothetical protein
VLERASHPDANPPRGRTREPGHNRQLFKRQFALAVTGGVAVTVVFVGVAIAVALGVARGARRRESPDH